ncbi:MAG: helix-turn-helix domain-containing protein [Anaerolineae bacterium]|nr:helix-turn-helix domain-containing protein [Anaerolineae bacterium]
MDRQERKLLGEFLKTRRERLSPEQFGLPMARRRRTPGLRREELAQLAGLSVTWYTWIEQGRDIGFSAEVLESLARVLQLLPPEKEHLFALAGMQPGQTPAQDNGGVAPVLQQILDHQEHYPAYLMDGFWNISTWNNAACALFGDFEKMPPAERNMVWYTLVRPETRRLVLNWEQRAQRVIAEFRADCRKYLTDPWLKDFVHRLEQNSPEFGQWWSRYDLQTREGGRRDFDHPLVGRLALVQTTFCLSHRPEVKMVIHAPLAEFDTEAKLQRLVRE